VNKNTSSFFKEHLDKDELIKWEASPRLFLLITEEWSLKDVLVSIALALFDFQIALAVIIVPFAIIGAIFYFLPLAGKIIGLAILVLFMTMKFMRIRKTRYAYSNKRIFISIWNWGKRRLQIIQLDEVGKVSTELYRNGGRDYSFSTNKTIFL